MEEAVYAGAGDFNSFREHYEENVTQVRQQQLGTKPELAHSREQELLTHVVEYDLKDLQPVRTFPAYGNRMQARYFDLQDFEDGYDRKLYDYQKVFSAGEENGLQLWLCAGADGFEDQYHLVAKRSDNKVRIISPAFDELLEATPTHVLFRIGDKQFQLSRGQHKMANIKYPFVKTSLPSCLEPEYTVLISEVAPKGKQVADTKSVERTHEVSTPVWQAFENARTEEAQPSAQAYALFKDIGDRVFAHIGADTELQGLLSHLEEPLHLPDATIGTATFALHITTSPESDLVSFVQKQYLSDQDALAQSMQQLNEAEFLELVDNPAEVQKLMAATFTERGFHMQYRRSSGDIVLLGASLEHSDALMASHPDFAPTLIVIAEQLNAYFTALAEQGNNAVLSLRARRLQLATELAASQQHSSAFKRFLGRLGLI